MVKKYFKGGLLMNNKKKPKEFWCFEFSLRGHTSKFQIRDVQK